MNKRIKFGKYGITFRNLLGWHIDVSRNGSQFFLVQLKDIFNKRFISLCWWNNVGFMKSNNDLPKFLFPKYYL